MPDKLYDYADYIKLRLVINLYCSSQRTIIYSMEVHNGLYLKQDLESYIKFHTVENLGSYGIDEITDFNIYYEARGNGVYSVYFLFA